MTGSALPTLDQLEDWSTAHLDDAAQQWPKLGQHSVDVANGHRTNMAAPGGTEWEGHAHQAAFESADYHATRTKAQTELYTEAADIARNGSANIQEIKRAALDAVAEARERGFRVNPDYTLSDTKPESQQTASRQQLGKDYEAYIRWKVTQLVAADDQVNAQLQAKAGQIHGSVRDGLVHAVDFRDEPPGDPGPNPPGPHPEFPGRNTLGQFSNGNTGDGQYEEKLALDQRSARLGVDIVRDKVRATVPGAFNEDGSPQFRYYDGLQPTGKPNEYIGLEGKRGPDALIPKQQRFDDLVSPQNPATATLNGQQIKIVRAETIYPDLHAGTGGGGVGEGGSGGAGRGGAAPAGPPAVAPEQVKPNVGPRLGGFGMIGGGPQISLPEHHGLEIYSPDPGPTGGKMGADGRHHEDE